jgi:NAD(P)-dependent dehydrogenase (short-subunit alcohol dehydrogenase family)
LASQIPNAKGRIDFLPIDVSNDASVQRAAQLVQERYGSLWAVVNNAGIASGSLSDILQVNVLGVRRVCMAFIPLVEQNGRIVNISSGVGPGYVSRASKEEQALLCDPNVTWPMLEQYIRGGAGRAGNAYGCSKAILNALTVLLARENPQLAINGCSPGWVQTDLTRGSGNLTPEQGTKSALVCLFNKLEGNGRYYGSDGLRSPLHKSRDPGTPEYRGP